MTAVKEQLMRILPEMERDIPVIQDSDAQQIVNLWFRVKPKRQEKPEQPKKSTTDENDDFDAKMDRCQEWAREAGLTPDDITASIKAVRQRRRQTA